MLRNNKKKFIVFNETFDLSQQKAKDLSQQKDAVFHKK